MSVTCQIHPARAGPKEKGRPQPESAPSIVRSDHTNSAENRNIILNEEDPGSFVVEVAGEGRRQFASHKAAYGFASGRRMTTGMQIIDRTRR